MVEIVCVACDAKYKRCSDCGGGGGSRAGTGKWRCAELFPPQRKTCSLKHQRLGAFPDMSYSVLRNTEIPTDEVDELSQTLEGMFVNAMLAGQSRTPSTEMAIDAHGGTCSGLVRRVAFACPFAFSLSRLELTMFSTSFCCRAVHSGGAGARRSRFHELRGVLRTGNDGLEGLRPALALRASPLPPLFSSRG